jgi:hypothetical protein
MKKNPEQKIFQLPPAAAHTWPTLRFQNTLLFSYPAFAALGWGGSTPSPYQKRSALDSKATTSGKRLPQRPRRPKFPLYTDALCPDPLAISLGPRYTILDSPETSSVIMALQYLEPPKSLSDGGIHAETHLDHTENNP